MRSRRCRRHAGVSRRPRARPGPRLVDDRGAQRAHHHGRRRAPSLALIRPLSASSRRCRPAARRPRSRVPVRRASATRSSRAMASQRSTWRPNQNRFSTTRLDRLRPVRTRSCGRRCPWRSRLKVLTGPLDSTQVSLLLPPRCIEITRASGAGRHARQPARHHHVAVGRRAGEDAQADRACAAAGSRVHGVPTPAPATSAPAPARRKSFGRARMHRGDAPRARRSSRSSPKIGSNCSCGIGRLDDQRIELRQRLVERRGLAAPPGGDRRHAQRLAQQPLGTVRAESRAARRTRAGPSRARWRPARCRGARPRPGRGRRSAESLRSSSGSQ